jgi:Icc protein
MTNANVYLLQLTDLHLTADVTKQFRGVNPHETLKATLAKSAHQLSWSAVLLTGDLANDDEHAYALLPQLFADIDSPIYCMPGNHDMPDAMAAALDPRTFILNGSGVHGAWLIVTLDTSVFSMAAGHVSETELARLETTLSAHPDKYALIALHHPPVTMNSAWLDAIALKNSDALFAVLDRHPQVRVVTWGHAHQQFDARRDKVHLLCTPATCVQFKPGTDDFMIDSLPPAYRWFSLGADGNVETDVIYI